MQYLFCPLTERRALETGAATTSHVPCAMPKWFRFSLVRGDNFLESSENQRGKEGDQLGGS